MDLRDSSVLLNGSAFLTIPSGSTNDIILQDQNSDPIVPDDVTGSTITVTVGSTPIGAELLRTGQTTSYRTGDDGDIEAGRDTSFSVLANNNPFGNTNRFTDELGGQTYTNNIVIDWSTYDGSTVLGWRKTITTGKTWEQAVDGALAVSIGSFTAGWRLPNVNELRSICYWGTSSWVLEYAPFNHNSSAFIVLWSSTYIPAGAPNGKMTMTRNGNSEFQDKSASWDYMPVRNFTVSGTTLS